MTKVTLTKVFRSDKDKEGNPFIGKFGPYTKLAIKTVEHGEEKWLSGFDKPQTKDWQAGNEVDIVVTENGQYLNFSLPKAGGVDNAVVTMQGEKIAELEKRVKALEDKNDSNDFGNI